MFDIFRANQIKTCTNMVRPGAEYQSKGFSDFVAPPAARVPINQAAMPASINKGYIIR